MKPFLRSLEVLCLASFSALSSCAPPVEASADAAERLEGSATGGGANSEAPNGEAGAERGGATAPAALPDGGASPGPGHGTEPARGPSPGRSEPAPAPLIDLETERSGEACDLQHDASGGLHVVFTTSTHPAVLYGRWDGRAWALEIVDGAGFDTGARVSDRLTRLVVDGSGAPHVLYAYEKLGSKRTELRYAKKVASDWVRERVDGTRPALLSFEAGVGPALALNPSRSEEATVVYAAPEPLRGKPDAAAAVVARRTAEGRWEATKVDLGATDPDDIDWVLGDAAFVGDTLVFPVRRSSTDPWAPAALYTALVGWTEKEVSYVGIPSDLAEFSGAHDWDLAVAGPQRLLARSWAGLLDVKVEKPFKGSTWRASYVPTSSSGGAGDVAWNGSAPVLLERQGGHVELGAPNAQGFWTWTVVGMATGGEDARLGLALSLHPRTGSPSICYQSEEGRLLVR